MATRIEEILGKDINSIKELREAIKQLQDSIANANPESEEFKRTTEQITAAQEQLNSVLRASKNDVNAASDSIAGMEKEYKNLYNTYRLLTEEQRNSAMGKQMAEDLNTLSNKLNDTKKDVGNFKDNIGRYTDSITEAFKGMGINIGGLVAPMKSAQTASQGLGKALKSLKANPVGAAIMAIVVAFKALGAIVGKVKEAINKNEESQMKLKEVMSQFQPVVDAVSNAFDKLGQIVVKVIGWLADAFAKLREIRGAVTDFLGITKGAKNQIKEQNKEYKELAKAQNQLIKNKREYQVLNAKDKAEVERLREEASEATNLEEKRRLLTEAKEKQAEIDARNIELAKEEVRILQEQSKHTANDAAENEKLAAAIANVANMEAAAAANARMFNKQLNAGSGGGGKSKRQEQIEKEKEAIKESQKELVEYYRTDREKLEINYREKLALYKKYQEDTTLLDKKYKEDKEKLDKDETNKLKEQIKERLTAQAEFDNALRELLINASSPKERSSIIANYAKEDKEAFEVYYNTITDGLPVALQKYKNFKEQVDELIGDGIISKEKAEEGVKQMMETNFGPLTDMVNELNTKLGTDLKFPPEITDENIAKFQQQLDALLKIYKDDYLQKLSDATEEAITSETYSTEFIDTSAGEKTIQKFTGTFEEQVVQWKRMWYEYVEEVPTAWEDMNLELLAQEWDSLEQRRAIIEQELENESILPERKKELEEELTEVMYEQLERREAIYERQRELNKELTKDIIGLGVDLSKSLDTAVSSYESLISAEIQDEKTTKKEAEKKKKTLKALAVVQLTTSIAQIAGTTAQGIMDLFGAWGGELNNNAETAAAAGPAAAGVKAGLDAKSTAMLGIRTAGLVANAVAQIAAAKNGYVSKVKSIEDMGGSSNTGGGVIANVASIDTNPYTYTRTLQDTEEEDTLNDKYVVRVVDIETALNHRVKVINESSF